MPDAWGLTERMPSGPARPNGETQPTPATMNPGLIDVAREAIKRALLERKSELHFSVEGSEGQAAIPLAHIGCIMAARTG